MVRLTESVAKLAVDSGTYKYTTKGRYKRYIKDLEKYANRSKKPDNPFGSKKINKPIVRLNRKNLPYMSPLLNDRLQREKRNKKIKSRLRIKAA